MRIALSRLSSPVRNREEAIQRLAHVCQQAVADAADLIVFPEMVMPMENAAGAACNDLLLTPSDLQCVAAQAGPVPVLVGASIASRPAVHPSPADAAVYSLRAGAVAVLPPYGQASQVLAPPGWTAETMVLRNAWLGPEQIHEHHRPHFLKALQPAVAFDFFAYRCFREVLTHLPLRVYWHRVAAGGECVCDNGIIRAHPVSRSPDQGSTEDASVIVDLATQWGESRESLATTKRAGSTLILGCATRLPIRVGAVELEVELQRSWRQFSSGMMFRDPLTDAEGMLFAYPRPKRASFYMANTKAPLSCAYIDPEGTILEIHDLEPFNRIPIRAGSDNIQFVLETSQGWFTRHGVTLGAALVMNGKSPCELFFEP
jgi:uncharacterized membrane protein (UPF0127 family)